MRELLEREQAINMYFRTGKGYKIISSELGVPLDTVKSWIRRYRISSVGPEAVKSRSRSNAL